MRFRSIAVLLSTVAFVPLSAQTASPSCPGGALASAAQVTQDACQQAVDLFNYMRPQLGIAMAGGNTTLGQGGALGGFPHFAIGVRANLFPGQVPTLVQPSYFGATSRSIETSDQFLGLPAVDAAIGVFKGFPLGVTNVGGIDVLLSASYVPDLSVETTELGGSSSSVSIDPSAPVQIAYGARIGLIQESILVPGVGVSILRRGLPKTTITGVVGPQSDSVSVRDLDMHTTSWRLTASKSLILFSIAAGIGQDTYDASTTIAAVAHAPAAGRQTMSAAIDEKMTRLNYFADLSYNLAVLKIIAEVGMTTGGSASTFNSFDKNADASRVYGSVGIRVGF